MVIAAGARFWHEKLHYLLHDLLAGSVTEPFKTRVGFDRYGANAVGGRSESQLHEGQACRPGEAAQGRLEQDHLRRRPTFPDHSFAHHTDRLCCSMGVGQADRCIALHSGQTAPIFLASHQVACIAGEGTVDGTGYSLPSEALTEGAGLLLDVGDQCLHRGQTATSQQRLPGQKRSPEPERDTTSPGDSG